MRLIYWPILLLALVVGSAHATTLEIPTTHKFKRDLAASWTAANPVLQSGEPGVETDTLKMKIGDGVTDWNSLDYIAGEGGSYPEGYYEIDGGTASSITFTGVIDGGTP